MSHFDKYREELTALGLSSAEDLLQLVSPMPKHTIKFGPTEPVSPSGTDALLSHFGGQPYFEQGEQWPHTAAGQPLDFIFQVVNTGTLNLPDHIQLLQFYYHWESNAWDTKDEGWLIKTYSTPASDKLFLVKRPESLGKRAYCHMQFTDTLTLPGWDGLDDYHPNASKLSCILNEDQPWENYKAVVESLGCTHTFQSTLGGYPHWLQGANNPLNTKGDCLPLLFQLDSENKANLMWGDMGLVYVFYDPHETGRFEFRLQCL